MSEIFKIVLLKSNQKHSVYTFDITKKSSGGNIQASIYKDDTIQRIKEKIYIY